MSELKGVLFISRNKDNKHLAGFKERRVSFLSDKHIDDLLVDFKRFVEEGLPNEKCRLYQHVNSRDNDKIRKALLHELIDNDTLNMSRLDAKIVSLASRKENRAESKWLFDFDDDKCLIGEFVEDVMSYIPDDVEVAPYNTPNGYAVVVSRGFDTRELLSKWDKVELKRDDLLCLHWMTNE